MGRLLTVEKHGFSRATPRLSDRCPRSAEQSEANMGRLLTVEERGFSPASPEPETQGFSPGYS